MSAATRGSLHGIRASAGVGSVWTPYGSASSPPSGTCKLLSQPAACHPISFQQGVWQICRSQFSPDEAKLGTGDMWQAHEICLEKDRIINIMETCREPSGRPRRGVVRGPQCLRNIHKMEKSGRHQVLHSRSGKSSGSHSDPAWFCDEFYLVPELKREMTWSSKTGHKRYLTFYLCSLASMMPGVCHPATIG